MDKKPALLYVNAIGSYGMTGPIRKSWYIPVILKCINGVAVL